MGVESLSFFQIFWDDSQLPSLYPFAKPYRNETLTPFFENTVIGEVVPKTKADKIAVCSWALRQKYRTFSVPPVGEITLERLMGEYDVFAFTKNTNAHQMLAAMDSWHKGSRDILQLICAEIRLKFPSEVEKPIYQNAFCATSEIYKAYVKEALIPAMYVMSFNEEIRKLCWQDSNYYKLKDFNKDSDFAKRVKKYLGTDYCPLHTFLLERLFSVWIHGKGLKIITV